MTAIKLLPSAEITPDTGITLIPKDFSPKTIFCQKQTYLFCSRIAL